VDFALGTKGTNELFIFLVLAVLRETAKAGRTTVKSLGALVESLFETVVDESLLEDLDSEREREREKVGQFLVTSYRFLLSTHIPL
jgi:hypothetical protein